MQFRVSWKRALFGFLLGVATVTLILTPTRHPNSMSLVSLSRCFFFPAVFSQPS